MLLSPPVRAIVLKMASDLSLEIEVRTSALESKF